MIPIIDLCWQGFTPVTVNRATVGEIYSLAQEHGTNPFVIHDSADRTSALVLPDAATRAIDMFGMPRTMLAAAVGLFDMLRRNQMTVSFDQPASLVMRLSSSQQIGAIVAVDSDEFPVGLLIPGSVTERLPHSHWIVQSSPALQQQITALTAIGDLAGAIAALETERQLGPGDFHSESLNALAPDAYTCGGDAEDGPHTINVCPCGYHPGGSCVKRTVAWT